MVACSGKSHFNGTVLNQKASQSITIFWFVFYFRIKTIMIK